MRAVVDVQRCLGDLPHPPGQPTPVVVGQPAGADVLQRHPGLGGEQPHGDLHAAHLQREDDRGHPVLDRRGAGEIQAQGRLADRGPGRDDPQLAAVQAVGELVEVGEPRRHPGQGAVVGLDRLDLLQRRVQQLAERGVVIVRAPLGHLVDGRLGPVDDIGDVGRRAVGELHDARAGLGQPAQHGLLRDDARVVAGVRRGRDAGDQRVHVGRPADPLQQVLPAQLGRDADDVGRLPTAVEVADRGVDGGVRRPVEVARTEDLDDVRDRVLREQHAAQHALLRRKIVGRGAIELDRGSRPARDVGDAQASPSRMSTGPPAHRRDRAIGAAPCAGSSRPDPTGPDPTGPDFIEPDPTDTIEHMFDHSLEGVNSTARPPIRRSRPPHPSGLSRSHGYMASVEGSTVEVPTGRLQKVIHTHLWTTCW
ncbi:hypothetical protein FMEAI12_4850045 [Parafrankia sp. Ea1.12]|nr:hypothetical protein FMEAI12_4850045 [Parafrankia sp. Ea1.12]